MSFRHLARQHLGVLFTPVQSRLRLPGPDSPPGTSCWDTTYVRITIAHHHRRAVPGAKERFADLPAATEPKIPDPANAVVDCVYDEKPIEKADNKYDASLRRCARTF